MLPQPRWDDVPFWYPLEIPDEDADEVLLELLLRDSAAAAWRVVKLSRAELRERRRNGQPSRLVLAEHDERDRQQRADDAARHAASMAEQRRQQDERQRMRAESQRKFEAEREAMLAHLRQEWIDLLEAMGRQLAAVPRYRHLVAGVERDIAMIRDAPPGPLPWRLDRQTFANTFATLRAEADATAEVS